MKSRISMILILTLLPSMLLSQERSYGIKGGWSISNFWGDGTEDVNNAFSDAVGTLDEQNLYWFSISLFSKRELLPDFLAIQSELMYVRNGKSWEADGDKFKVYADYLQMPWLLKITMPVFLRPSIYFGPHIAWMFRARVEDVPGTLENEPFFAGKDPDGRLFEGFTNVIDGGLTAGLDFDIPFGPGNVVVDLRYTLGALNVFNFAEGDRVRNYSFLIMAGYSIDFGGNGFNGYNDF